MIAEARNQERSEKKRLFGALVESGQLHVEALINESHELDSNSVRAIVVPFFSRGAVEIASITESQTIELEPGEYMLIYEAYNKLNQPSVKFTFIPGECKGASILKRDAALSPEFPLSMDAKPG